MDIASIIGMFGAVGLNLLAIGPPNLKMFIDPMCLLIVFGGTFMLILSSFPFKNVTRIGSYCWYAFVPPKMDTDRKEVRNKLEMGILILDRAKTYFQALGWIGMLIGLVLLLANLSDPHAIGPAMATAMLPVFYGVAMAYLFCLPIKTKLQFHLNRLKSTITGSELITENKTKNNGTRKIDVSSILGLLGCVTLILIAMKNPEVFFNIPSVLIVVGGTVSLALLSGPLKTVGGFAYYYCYAFVSPNFEEDEKKIRENLEPYIFYFDRIMTFQKGCGGVGVLIGFVLVCHNYNDPASIGPALAISFLAGLYSLIMAYVFMLPLKTRLECHVNSLLAQS